MNYKLSFSHNQDQNSKWPPLKNKIVYNYSINGHNIDLIRVAYPTVS